MYSDYLSHISKKDKKELGTFFMRGKQEKRERTFRCEVPREKTANKIMVQKPQKAKINIKLGT